MLPDIGELRRHRWKGCPCVWTLSTGRCGTKTLAAVLNLSPDLNAVHEPFPRLLRFSKEVYEQRYDRDTRNTMLELAREDPVYFTCRGRTYVETAWRMTLLAPVLKEVFSESRFIWLRRPLRDVVASYLERGIYLGNAFDADHLVPVDGQFRKLWPTLNAFSRTCWLVCELDRLAQQHAAVFGAFTLDSEDLFQGRLDDLFEWLGVERPKRLDIVLDQKLNATSDRQIRDVWPEEWTQTFEDIRGALHESLPIYRL